MLKHSPARIEQSRTVHGVRAGHVVHSGLFDGFVRPRSEHVGADDPVGGPGACGIALEDAEPMQATSFQWIVADDGVTIENPAWSWRPGSVFLGLDGALTQEEQPTGFSLRMGIAIGPHEMEVARHEVMRGDHINPSASAAAVDFPKF